MPRARRIGELGAAWLLDILMRMVVEGSWRAARKERNPLSLNEIPLSEYEVASASGACLERQP